MSPEIRRTARRLQAAALAVILVVAVGTGLSLYHGYSMDQDAKQAPKPTPTATIPPPAVLRLGVVQNSCVSTQKGCARELLGLMNAVRAKVGSPPLALDWTETHCGSAVHAKHLVAVVTDLSNFGIYAHDQFPQDICVVHGIAGENVGEMYGSKDAAIRADFGQMMSEDPGWPDHPTVGSCVSSHACNIGYRGFRSVGIAFAYSPALQAWLIVQDFIG